VKSKKMPRQQLGGNANNQAAALVERIRNELGNDVKALRVVRDVVRLLAARSRGSRRRD